MTETRLLFVGNFPSGTRYAWRTIEQVFAAASDRLRSDGVRALACYPSLEGLSTGPLREAVEGSFAFEYAKTSRLSEALRFAKLLRAHRIHLLYLTDQPTWSWRYALFRWAGVRGILVHERSSGTREPRGAFLQMIKRAVNAVRPLAVDRVIAISRFVADRLVRVSGVPRSRVMLIHNGIDFRPFDRPAATTLHAVLGLPAATRLVFASGRAMPYKGIPVLLEAARMIEENGPADVHFAYAGDGPSLESFRDQAAELRLRRVHLLDRRDDAIDLLRSATIAVIPSVWAEAFGLTVVEGMAAGLPVVASRTGGIPELIDDGVTGLLVPPGDADALACAIRGLLDDAEGARAMGQRAAVSARQRFSLDRVADEVAQTIRELL